jgi:NADPH-dependent curcumin reductase
MQQVVLAHALTARPVASDFALVEAPEPVCPADGVVIAVRHVSLDPYVGSRLRGRHMGEAPPVPGVDPIPGAVVGAVVESRCASVPVGALVHTMEGGWAEQVAVPGHQVRILALQGEALSAHLGVLGMPGLTAWAGMTQLAKVGPGDVVLVDAAAGPVGGTVGQIARLRGAARVVGIAGGPDKCALVTGTYGFDACVDYKAEGWQEALGQALPQPPSVHFENVSTAMATLALGRLAPYGRMVLCGLVDQYHADAPPPGLPAGLIVGKRAQVSGLVVYDFYGRWAEFLAELQPAVARGAIVIAEDAAHGLAGAPAQFQKLLEGRHLGKALVSL